MPRKSLYLSLLSLAYMQIGFRSTQFLLRASSSQDKVYALASEHAVPIMAA
jgi:hypothetical protein